MTKNLEDRKDFFVTVRVTKGELDGVLSLAKKHGFKNISKFIRWYWNEIVKHQSIGTYLDQ